MKTSLEGFKGIFEQKEERSSEFEDRIMESIEFEEQKENRLEKYEQSLRGLWDTIEQTSCGSPRKRRDRNEQRGYLKK